MELVSQLLVYTENFSVYNEMGKVCNETNGNVQPFTPSVQPY